MLLNLSTYKLLIVEDDDLSFRYLEVVLSKKTDIKIIRAINGLEAVQIMKSDTKIDLVLMDIQLPVMNGIEAIKKIREFSQTPIIVQTANALKDDEQSCRSLGITSFITKPISMDTLLNSVINNVSALPIFN